mmetsp:Transcript_16356/g.28611  ORF Transcript_16356/g.28611 Transcript_16356/m.28611 type:complete len:106 (+) Transcript_16356:85-402(+)
MVCFVASGAFAQPVSRKQSNVQNIRPMPAKAAAARALQVSRIQMMAESKNQQEMSKTEAPIQQKDSFVKLAMRNMVYQAPKSVVHFGITFVALIAFFVGISYLTK